MLEFFHFQSLSASGLVWLVILSIRIWFWLHGTFFYAQTQMYTFCDTWIQYGLLFALEICWEIVKTRIIANFHVCKWKSAGVRIFWTHPRGAKYSQKLLVNEILFSKKEINLLKKTTLLIGAHSQFLLLR